MKVLYCLGQMTTAFWIEYVVFFHSVSGYNFCNTQIDSISACQSHNSFSKVNEIKRSQENEEKINGKRDFINQSLLSRSYVLRRAFPIQQPPHTPLFQRWEILYIWFDHGAQTMRCCMKRINHGDSGSGSGHGRGDGDDTIKRAKVNKSWINHKTTTELSSCD